MTRKLDKWSTAQGILEELHHIREQNEQLRQQIGTEAWLKNINSASKRLGLDKRRKQSPAHS